MSVGSVATEKPNSVAAFREWQTGPGWTGIWRANQIPEFKWGDDGRRQLEVHITENQYIDMDVLGLFKGFDDVKSCGYVQQGLVVKDKPICGHLSIEATFEKHEVNVVIACTISKE